MMYHEKAYDTAHVSNGEKVFCSYCGKEIEPFTTWDEYEGEDWYHCDCADARKEFELNKQYTELQDRIRELEKQYPKQRYRLVTRTVLEKID